MISLFDSASSTLNDAFPGGFERSPELVAQRRYAIMLIRIFPEPVTCLNPIAFNSRHNLVTAFPTPASISAFRKAVTNPQRLVAAAAVQPVPPNRRLLVWVMVLVSDVTQPWEIGVAPSAPKIIAAKCLPSTPIAGGNPEYVGRISRRRNPTSAASGRRGVGHRRRGRTCGCGAWVVAKECRITLR